MRVRYFDLPWTFVHVKEKAAFCSKISDSFVASKGLENKKNDDQKRANVI